MMIIYLFFTVILMLNVLIALINSGYDESDRTWELVWLQNRLLYIESAENLSHSIPGKLENKSKIVAALGVHSPAFDHAKIQEYKSRWKKSDGRWSVEEREEDTLERRVRSLRKQINEDRLALLLMKGGRMDKLEKQLKRIEKMLKDRGVKTGSETDESTVDESSSDE
ncbi:hypothetical protein BGX21_008077 [Mortierella sp. AD011]|nr:hypothetical protein BGX20_008178 [Mortierella sp. AD010]KAF9398192.1 hypothetical protein BGX21_008077 [Mortierella sp. AD011]